MINTLLWILFGAMSGWIGYLATRDNNSSHLGFYLVVGVIGGLAGGMAGNTLGLSGRADGADPSVLFSSIMVSAFLVGAFAILLNFFGKASSN